MNITEIIEGLSTNERRLLISLGGMNGTASPSDLIGSGDFDLEVEIMGAASWLASKGLVSIKEDVQKFFEMSDPSIVEKGLPERRALSIIDSSG
ncbi:MAG: phenylalanine--tRNA ligase subunit alpha, partial [Candidatus Methanoplasma sp.]|nr:phenylalanine--tRNA ligase subunit alpha [Candidatus Methanoplasma sp.]